jgi:hypothetical protein
MALVITCALSGAFGQCGKLVLNPITGQYDCSGTGSLFNSVGTGILNVGGAITLDTSVATTQTKLQSGTPLYCNSSTGIAR